MSNLLITEVRQLNLVIDMLSAQWDSFYHLSNDDICGLSAYEEIHQVMKGIEGIQDIAMKRAEQLRHEIKKLNQ